jgi:hypothetical protein
MAGYAALSQLKPGRNLKTIHEDGFKQAYK